MSSPSLLMCKFFLVLVDDVDVVVIIILVMEVMVVVDAIVIVHSVVTLFL